MNEFEIDILTQDPDEDLVIEMNRMSLFQHTNYKSLINNPQRELIPKELYTRFLIILMISFNYCT
jgi:hypothetical protein